MSRTIREVAAEIATDAENDARTLDGRPFDGKTVAEILGQNLAMIQALARCVGQLDEHLDRIEAALAERHIRPAPEVKE